MYVFSKPKKQNTYTVVMSKGAGGGGGASASASANANANARKKIVPPTRDKDEDLLLFRELHKREKDRLASLLLPVSDEFEANGNYPLYRISSGKRGGAGEFLAETESDKNDYDWLKTPPATPLFPSLEMEANAPELSVQRDIPIIQPLSRFAAISHSVANKANTGRSTPPNPNTNPIPKPKLPTRSITPGGRRSISLTDQKKGINNKSLSPKSINQKMRNHQNVPIVVTSTAAKPAPTMSQKESHLNFLASNPSKSMGSLDSSTKAKTTASGGLSPHVRSTNGNAYVTSQIPGFSNETPSNLRTKDRPSSALRGRSGNQIPEKQEPANNATARLTARRQSCSPRVSRGRKLEEKQASNEANVAALKGRIQTGSRGQVLGSKMVDRFISARKSNAEDREIAKVKLHGSINENAGFGRLISKGTLDMALKHTGIKREVANSNPINGKKSAGISSPPS